MPNLAEIQRQVLLAQWLRRNGVPDDQIPQRIMLMNKGRNMSPDLLGPGMPSTRIPNVYRRPLADWQDVLPNAPGPNLNPYSRI